VISNGIAPEDWNRCYVDALNWTREMGKLLDG
jgi:hypothetical protein